MLRIGPFVFKCAETPAEIEQVHRLNYRTFVSEIQQYDDPGTGVLIDKFHDKNRYFICLRDGQVVGMLAGHGQPPFSVAERLPDPAILTSPGIRPIEVRLLAVDPTQRHGLVFPGLIWVMYHYARDNGYTHFFISGVAGRVELYEHIGFQVLGPAVKSGAASFVPMVVTIQQLEAKLKRQMKLWENHLQRNGLKARAPEPVCLLPGPVTVAPAVREAFHLPPIYHRGPEFLVLFRKVRQMLSNLVGGRDVALLVGSGTLANEVIAATLAAETREERGLLLVNGEFGQRLARQANRFNLHPHVLTWPWGQAWDLDEVESVLADMPPGSWVWGVHQESSTGVLNDLPGLVHRARLHGIRVCADCISSLGAAPLDLRDVYLASGATGKALGSYAGVAVVFANGASLNPVDCSRVPSYLDLIASLESPGPRFTFPSPLLRALEAALQPYETPNEAASRYAHYADLGEYVRQRLQELGLEPLAAEAWACPVITTFTPPTGETADSFVRRCRSWGFAIGGESGYLAERHLVQIATMGDIRREDCLPLFDQVKRWFDRAPALACARG